MLASTDWISMKHFGIHNKVHEKEKIALHALVFKLLNSYPNECNIL